MCNSQDSRLAERACVFYISTGSERFFYILDRRLGDETLAGEKLGRDCLRMLVRHHPTREINLQLLLIKLLLLAMLRCEYSKSAGGGCSYLGCLRENFPRLLKNVIK